MRLAWAELGENYYDVLPKDGRVKIANVVSRHVSIGDVTGHGLESGMLTVATQAAVSTFRLPYWSVSGYY